MPRSRLGIAQSLELAVSLGVALAFACSVYDESLLTGRPTGGDGTSSAGEGGADDGTAGTNRGGSATQGGTSGIGGVTGGSGMEETGGTATGGKGGSEAGEGGTGGTGAGGDGAGPATGGEAGRDAGGMAGSLIGGSGGSAGKAGSGGNAGNGGACGKCGCGMPETDSDSDTVLDCNDICMGLNDAHCTVLENRLVHRYSFSGTGTQVSDSKGTAHGTAINATLSGAGNLVLTGGNTSSPPYVNLPNGLISSLTNATIEMWVTWNQSGTTGQDWQRIFDFGTTGTEDMQVLSSTASMSYVYLSPKVGATPSGLSASYTTSGLAAETIAGVGTALARGTVQHLALVIDDTNNQMALYLNGAVQASVTFTGALSGISDVNNWLGRSSHSGDYEFVGIFDEFRIYDVALTAAQISTARAGGPNAAFLE